MNDNIYNIQNEIYIFIVKFLKTQNCKKIFLKFNEFLFLFEINIQLKNNTWIKFSIVYEIPNNLYIFNDNSSLTMNQLKKNFQKYLNKNKKNLNIDIDK